MIGIYKITSPSNKVYVGQSTNIEKRWSGYSTNKKKMTDIYQDPTHKNTLLKIYSHITASNLDKDNMYQELINNRTFNHGIYMKYRF
jgi:excinuclease UvrABC nuclease subunit